MLTGSLQFLHCNENFILAHDGSKLFSYGVLNRTVHANILISSCLTREIFCLVVCFFLVAVVDISVKT